MTYAADDAPAHTKGKVIDLVLPVIILIAFCVTGMIYSGGFFSGKSFITAFSECDASYGLSLGSLGALIVIIVYFICRRVLTFTNCMDSISAGFKQKMPPSSWLQCGVTAAAWLFSTIICSIRAKKFIQFNR